MRNLYLILLTAIVFSNELNGQSACGNRDFENQTFSGWLGFIGMNNTPNNNLTLNPGLNDLGLNQPHNSSAQHTILTINGLDSFCIDPVTQKVDPNMTWLAPGGGLATVRLGNSINGAQAEMLSFSLNVTASDTIFTFQYASVLEDPGHPMIDQPGFMVIARDINNSIFFGDTIYAADPSYPFIVSAYQGAPILYRRWAGYSINLTNYVGQTVTLQFANFDCAYAGHFGYTYLDATCFGSPIANVWPGDCDYDLMADNMDLIPLGIAFGSSGPTRSGATNSWVAQPSADWTQSFPLAANYKHSDCNGDGMINLDDTLAIVLNYNNTHPFRLMPETPVPYSSEFPDLYLECSMDSLGSGQSAVVEIKAGTSTYPVDSLYALALSLQYDSVYLNKNSIALTSSGSWLGTTGTDMLTFSRNFYSQGIMDITFTKINHQNVLGGNGSLGAFIFQVTQDTAVSGVLNLKIKDVKAVTKTGRVVSLNILNESVVINNGSSGMTDLQASQSIALFPNPTSGPFSLYHLPAGSKLIRITDITGQIVFETNTAAEAPLLETNLPSGLYSVQIRTGEKILLKKLMIRR